MKTRRTVLGLVLMMLSLNALSQRVSSPNGKLTLKSKDSGYVVYYGKQAVLEQFYEILPIGAPLVMMVLSLLFCALQAIVYTTLVSIYLDEGTEVEEH